MSTQIQPFSAEIRRTASDAVAIVLRGEINKEADAGVSAAFEAALSEQPAAITLDFSAVDYINSTGIALIVGVLARARAAHIPLTAVGLSDHYREIFTITRLSDFIEIR